MVRGAIRFSRDQLIDKALGALIAVMQSHEQGPVREKAGLRFVLAFLATGDREPFDTFWREAVRETAGLVEATRFGHYQTMRNAYGVIALRHGRDYW